MNTSKKIRNAKNIIPKKKPSIKKKKELNGKWSEAILESYPETVFLLTKAGTIIYAGKQVETVFGRSPEEIEGKNFTNFVLKEHVQKMQEKLDEVFEQGSISPFRTEMMTDSKDSIPVRTNACKIKKGAHSYALVTIQDITKILRTEEQLIEDKILAGEIGALKSILIKQHVIELEEQVSEINRLSDLICRNNKNVLLTNSFANIIKSTASTISETIQRMQDTAKIEASQLAEGNTEFCLNELIIQISRNFASEAFEKLDNLFMAHKTLSDKDSHISADKFNLNKVLSILIRNSLKATKGGSINFGYSVLQEQGMLEFFVKDTGERISNKMVTLFNLCDQEDIGTDKYLECVKKELPIAKTNVRKMGGKMRYVPGKFKGNEFYFTIPFITETKEK